MWDGMKKCGVVRSSEKLQKKHAAGQPLKEDESRELLEKSAPEIAEKHTPSTASKELEALAAKYWPFYTAGELITEDESRELIEMAAREIAEQHTPRTAATELAGLAAKCLQPGASEQQGAQVECTTFCRESDGALGVVNSIVGLVIPLVDVFQ